MAARIPGVGRVTVSERRSIIVAHSALPAVGWYVQRVVVIGVDDSEAAKEALLYGLHEASIRGTRVRAVHAWSHTLAIPATGPGLLAVVDPTPLHHEAEGLLRTILEAVAGDAADRIDRVVVEAPAGAAIIDNARDAELIVVGRSGPGAVRSLVLGSVSSYVVGHATCPVLVVPAPRSGRD